MECLKGIHKGRMTLFEAFGMKEDKIAWLDFTHLYERGIIGRLVKGMMLTLDLL
jgi:hypothetical protein